MRVQTRLGEIRRSRGIAAVDLARQAGVSRQTIYAIEEGSFVPNTTVSLQLARALDVSIEELFSLADENAGKPIRAGLLPGDRVNEGQLVRVCRVNQRVVAIPTSFLPAYLPAADGIVESRSRLQVRVQSLGGLPSDSNRLLIAGCDPALSLLHDALTNSGIEIISVPCPSRRALQWLKDGRVHAAGSHLLDRATGEYNLPIIRRLLPNAPVRVITFAVWEQGLVMRKGNPKGIRSIADLASGCLRLMNREKGSGSRDLLDSGLRQAGIRPERVKGYHSAAQGHLAAAYAVASGEADCCIAPRSAARCYGLDFVSLAVERFDLSFDEASIELPAVKAVLDVLNRSNFKKRLQSIAGYDTAHTGQALT